MILFALIPIVALLISLRESGRSNYPGRWRILTSLYCTYWFFLNLGVQHWSIMTVGLVDTTLTLPVVAFTSWVENSLVCENARSYRMVKKLEKQRAIERARADEFRRAEKYALSDRY